MNRMTIPIVPPLAGTWRFRTSEGKDVKMAVLVQGLSLDGETDNRPSTQDAFDTATGLLRGHWLACLCADGRIRMLRLESVKCDIPRRLKDKQAELVLTEHAAERSA